ncbi:MAG: gliding motility-associated C-terminal domain-containing protein [Flavobacteriales bacterium]|nr:gliding motility-associated C-terminal domain-containing protein [Flavobacteriales bacterium]
MLAVLIGVLPLFALAQPFIMAEGQVFASCSGDLFDPSGPSANYSDSQVVTATLCPTGGPDAGPLTKVLFTQWDLAPGPGDHLHIYQGTEADGPPFLVGSHDNSLLDQTVVSDHATGCLSFEWTTDGTDNAAGWAARVITGPDAGVDATASSIVTGPTFFMLDSLGGTPAADGSWTTPGGDPCDGQFDPAVDPFGEYTYTVAGTPPCPNAVSTLQVLLRASADAGTNGTLVLCSTDGVADLFASLGGTPETGGTWTAPGGAGHPGTFDPGSDPEGVYTYTVLCSPQPCTDATATVTVTVNDPPDAGSNASVSTCSNAASFDLFSRLGGSPDTGGAWTGPGGAPVASTFTPGTSPQGVYTYTVLGAPPCTNATATVNVTVVAAPNAGTSQAITVCSNAASFSMNSRLGGTPQAGGTWTAPGGAAHGPTFDPATDVAGAYTYTVNGTAPCVAATATLTITLQAAPRAGTNGTITKCSTDASFSLLSVLGGSPDGGGSWTAPGGSTFPGTFIPGTSAAGIYTYTVAGIAPCSNATATVTVSVNAAPNAGTNATVARCSNSAEFNLYGQLGGSPTPGGTWTGPQGASSEIFTPGTSTPGAYTYTVLGTAPCANASAVVTVTITQAPNAGISGSTSVCTNSAPFALIDLLGGSPSPSGTWTAPGGASNNGTFTPGTSAAGTYTYTVLGQSPCANATATVAVTTVAPPNPGTNGTLAICSNAASVNLSTRLGGTPATGGTWTRPNGTAHSGVFDPSTDASGTYTYTVAGTAPCSAASAAVQVTKTVAPNAGTDGSISVCSTTAPFELITVLGGTPNGGGTWRTPANAAFSGTFTPGTTPAGVYKYIVLGTAPCANDTALVTVVVNQAPNAGTNSASTVCSNQASFNLLTRLGGTPNGGGTWTGPNNQPFPGGIYVPGTSLQGAYTYTVAGLTPCLDASAVVAITEHRQPVAGTTGSFAACSTDGAVDLFDELGGTPDAGGSWTAPGGGASSGTFLPDSDAPGIYTYTLSATAPCTTATATVTAVVNQAPDAGTNSVVSVCADQATVDLFNALGGTPDAGGTWSDDDATGQLSGQLFSPTGLPPGNYDFTYTVIGNGQCGNDIATVRVTIVAGLDAGLNGTLSACNSNALVDLFTGLTGTPQPGGIWYDISGTGALTGQFFNATLVPGGSYTFKYKLPGTTSCSADSANVTVNVTTAPNAGTNGSTVACSNVTTSFNLFTFLGGNPQTGGIWTRGATVISNMYTPATDAPGVLTYTVSGTAPCPNATATVTVSEVTASNAGTSASTTVCSNDGAFNMTLRLGGTPQAGNWSLGGIAHGNIFQPGVDVPGVYLYTVPGQFPCGDAIATLTVNVNNAPDAGVNASYTTCSDAQSFLLIELLTGSPQGNGNWTGPDGVHSGLYAPSSDDPGDYFYTVAGSAPCASDVSVVTIFENDRPNAGTPTSISLCSNGAAVDLLSVLGGTPSPTGTWTGPAPATTPFNGVFIPGTSVPGTYTYTVAGTPPCSNATSTVTVAVNQPPNAGTSRAITVCTNDGSFALIDSLGGTPALNGIWTPPPPLLTFNGVFNSASSPAGVYTYTVAGTAPCANAVATVTVTKNQQANAGIDADASVCSTDGALNMFTLLGPSAQAGGNWTVQSTGATHSATFLPTVDVSNIFVYTVLGLPGCANDAALVDVTLNNAPNAGFNGLVTVCDSDDPFQLVNELSGTPQLNGTWVGPTNQTHSGIFVPGTDPPGVYTYTVDGATPCDDATAQVTVIVNGAPDAGENGVISVCSSSPPFSLFGELGGSPDAGGVWTNPAGQVVGVNFNPATSAPGVYKYRIQGAAPCASDSATVTVFVNTAPNAGISTVTQICSSSGPVTLVDLLGGTPGPGGAWTFSATEHGPVFDPAVDVSGAYVYTVVGITPCANAVAQVQITLVPEPNAGIDGAIAACLGATDIALAGGLSGTPNAGGTWNDDDGTGELSDGVLDGSSLAPGTYHFTYVVSGVGPCDDDSAVVTVEIVADLDAGTDSSATVCGNEIPELFTLLGGTPQAGGTWLDIDESGALIGGYFNASQVDENTTWRFDYVLPESSSCESDTARVTVTVQPSPFAGCDGFASFCSVDPPGGLIGSLPCGPDVNGTWFNPVGASHSGTFVPATDLPGTYLYVVGAIGGCASDTSEVEVEVTPASDAGINASASICSVDQPIALIDFLGPTAQEGGVWSINNNTVSGVYNPAIDGPGIYQYRVPGASPCPADFAFVTVSEPQAPEAGTSASITRCSDDEPFNMRDYLGGLPEQGGSWTGPGPDAHDEEFDPATDVAGTYTYVVAGVPPCVNDTARLTISLTPAPNAGSDSTVAACITQTSIDLFAALGAGAQTGGSWTDIDVSGALTDSIFDPSMAGNGTFRFQYAIVVPAPCSNAFSTITVVVGSGSSAGEDSTLTICGGYTAYPLINALGGDPDPGGTWVDQLGTGALLPGDSVLNASMIPPGTVAGFTYTVEDAGCGNVQATVQLTISDFPDAGGPSDLVLCTTADPVDLFTQLTGTPETGGVWTGPQGVPNNGIFVPQANAPGPYTYTVAGNEYCPDSAAVINVVVNEPPDAGSNGQIVLCDTLVAFPLITGLGGTPDATGTWTAVGGAGGLSGSTLNTTGLSPDSYEYLYTVQVEGCADASAIVKVDVVTTPQVVDMTTLCNEQDRTYTVTFTIEQGNPSTYQVIGLDGTISSSAPYTFISTPIFTSQAFIGHVRDANACGEFRIEGTSPCSFDSEVFVPGSFSPNGDGINENFLIPGIEGYPNNTITIFNRWGGEVYDAAGYNNSTVVWDGTSPDAAIAGNAPTGTYFYVLELGNSSEPITGFIQLIR